MVRKHSGRATKGSQYHLQNLVNEYPPKYLNHKILSNSLLLSAYAAEDPKWRSPLACQNYTEYRDSEFLQALDLYDLKSSLSKLWPRLGPSWDALATVKGKNGDHGVILLEAKSHLGELGSRGCEATAKSREKIAGTMAAIKQRLGVKEESDWMGKYYQYTNRLVHLDWLIKEGVSAWMVFMYFIGDREQKGPNTITEWRDKLNEMKTELRLPEHHRLSNSIIEVFVSVYPEVL